VTAAKARGHVVVAHDSEAIRGVVETLLRDAGFGVTGVPDGAACRRALETRPAAVVLDVALADVLAFELVEEARRSVPGIRIVLIASIYNRTSYKRRPTSLYGADDYVEQHHIADALVAKLTRLLPTTPGPASAPAAATPVENETVRAAAIDRVDARIAPEPAAEAVVRAQRLARLIVSDIALYNGDALAAARRGGGSAGLEARLRADLEEGRLLFDLRVPSAVRAGRDFIAEALAELVAGPREGG
jgi:DNA-binding response OmpR family regulator